jgi:beta-lactamase regulating signal transducer with metallopeptidase domain
MIPGDFVLEWGKHSLEASILAGVVLVTQRVFRKKLGLQWSCALWLLVAARLLPISIPSRFSAFNWLPAGKSENSTTISLHRTDPSKQRRFPPVLSEQIKSSTGEEGALSGATASSTAAVPDELIPAGATRWQTWLFIGWLLGAVGMAGYVLAAAVPLIRRVAKLRPLDNANPQRILKDCGERLQMRSAPVLCELDGVGTPALCGLFAPRLVLPVGLVKRVSEEELRFIFLHELAHVRRRDLALNWLSAALLSLHWFNPVVWLAFARWRVDREIASDAMAIEAAGANQQIAYGRTLLRLLENFGVQTPQAGLVGIFESKGALHRRIKQVAGFQPVHGGKFGTVLLAALTLIGLTDAQEQVAAGGFSMRVEAASPLVAPYLTGESVVFLVQASESMLGSTAEEVARRRNDRDDFKRAAPKWIQTVQQLHSLLEALPPATRARVWLFNEGVLPASPSSVFSGGDQDAIKAVMREVAANVPRGGMDLGVAFASLRDLSDQVNRVVLLTDGCATPDQSGQTIAGIKERYLQQYLQSIAMKELPRRVPVTTILLPYSSGDAFAAASFWQLANSTRGGLVMPAKPRSLPATAADELTHVALVIDTSGSMRDFNTEQLWPIVRRMAEEILQAHPHLTAVRVLDAEGRPIVRRFDTWLPFNPETTEQIAGALRATKVFSGSNPLSGIVRALAPVGTDDPVSGRLAVYVLGDEFSGSEEAVLRRLDELNPRDVNGNRRAVINAIGFPTTIRSEISMGNTGLKYANLMRRLTAEHDGMFIALPDL